MKYPHSSLILFMGMLATTGFAQTAATNRPTQKPTVLEPPAPPNGSAWSRAPAPAQRPFNDVKAIDGQAVDPVTQNTGEASIEPAVPPPRVAILQGVTATPAYATTYTTEPALAPTGRPTTYAFATGASAATRPAQKPVVLEPPAPPNGSAWSRAPAPAQRPFNDVKAIDGQAVDPVTQNTGEASTEPAVPPPRVAIFQPAPGATAEPALMPTGRSNMVAVAASMDTTNVAQSIRSATMANRDQILNDVESRMNASEKIMSSMSTVASNLHSDVKAKERALKKSISNARKDWDRNREQLAADYEAYAAALGRVDAANGIAP